MGVMAVEWRADGRGFDEAKVGRATVIVWTGSQAVDLDDGYEVCEAYIPTTDREFPDGLMIVGRRRLETRNRSEARAIAADLARAALAERMSYLGRAA